MNPAEPAGALIVWVECLLQRELDAAECVALGLLVASLVAAYEPTLIAKARAEDAAYRNN